MKTNKEFGDYVFEKAEKYKAKRAATIKRIASGIAGCLAFAVVVTLMGINGIFNVGNLNVEKEEPKVRMYSIDGHVSPQSEQNQPVAIRNNDVISYGMEKRYTAADFISISKHTTRSKTNILFFTAQTTFLNIRRLFQI